MRTIALLAALVPAAPAGAQTAVQLHVAPGGRDSWSGRLAVPNRARTDGPLATLEAARDALRAIPRRGPATVWIHPGIHRRTCAFVLEPRDGGRPGAPVAYRAWHGGPVRLQGGRPVGRWAQVSDPSLLSRLDPRARGRVLQADLSAQGIRDFGTLRRRGFGAPIVPAALELFCDGRPMTLARWPNGEEWAKIAGAPTGQAGGRFTYDGDRPRKWAPAQDIWIHGYWTYDWADTHERVERIDPEARVVETEPPHGVYGYTPGRRFYFQNILEELDSPGEWHLDRRTGRLLFWPPAPLSPGSVVVSELEEPLIAVRGASHVVIAGLTLECSRAEGVVVWGGSHVSIQDCHLRNLGTTGVVVDAGTDHRVARCHIHDTGDGGIELKAGDRRTLAPGRCQAVDNVIHHYSRWDRTYRPGVLVQGVGNRVAHCRIHDAPHNAILLGGNDHRIEFNEIFRVCTQTGDAGAFYMGRDFTERGNLVRFNLFRDIAQSIGQRDAFVEVMAVYLDDCASGTTVYGNLFVRAGRAAMIGGGRDNTIENNLFVDCSPAVHVDARGMGWAKFWFDGRDPTLMDRLKAVGHDRPPYRTRYPALAGILSDDPARPKGNRIVRNICVGGKWIEWLDGMDERTVEVRDNLVGGDAGLVPGRNGRFTLRPDSPALRLGFRPIPVDRIGPRPRRPALTLP